MFKTRFVYMLFFYLFCMNSYGQSPQFSNYTTAHGLSNNEVNCIFQDGDGFIWIGTDFGLNRFDGRQFKHYYASSSPADLKGNQISAIRAGQKGEMLVATEDGGLSVYSPVNDAFRRHPNHEQMGIGSNNLLSLAYDGDSSLWVSLHRRDCYVIPLNGRDCYFSTDSTSKFSRSFFDLFLASDSNLYTGTIARGLLKWNGSSWSDLNIPTYFPYPAHTVVAICEDKKSNLWFGGWDNGLYSQALSDSIPTLVTTIDGKDISFSSDEVKDMVEYKDEIWIGSRYSGLHIFNPASRQMVDCEPNYHIFGSIASRTINCLYVDSEDRMWVGTDRGLSIYDPKSFQFDVLMLEESLGQVDASERVTGFGVADEKLFVGTTSGLWTFEENNRLSKHPIRFGTQRALQVHSLLNSSAQGLILGTNNSGYLADASTLDLDEFASFRNHSDTSEIGFDFFQIEASRIVDISEGQMAGEPVFTFAAYGYGLSIFHQQTKVGFVSILHERTAADEEKSASLISNSFFDSSGRLWLFSEFGISIDVQIEYPEQAIEMWKYTSDKYSTYHKDVTGYCSLVASDTWKSLIPSDIIGVDVVEYEKDHFFASTRGQGLVEINLNDPPRFNYIKSPHQVMEGISIDQEGNLWVVAEGGLATYNVEDDTWQSFGPADGFPTSGVSGDVFIDDSGHAYAGGDGFLIHFKPELLLMNQALPPVKITELSIKNIGSLAPASQADLSLEYTDNTISFSFAALNFTNPEKNQFAYRLLGLETDWVYCGDQNHIRFTDLKGGDYCFQVKAANNHGLWNETPTEFRFSIRPPFWERPLFWPLTILCMAIFGTAFYFWRRQEWRKLERFRLEGEMNGQESERKRLASELHDEVGTRLSVLKLYLNSLEKLSSPKSQSQGISQKAQELLDEGVADLRNMLHDLSPEAVHKFGLIKALENLTERLNHAADVQAHLVSDESNFELSARVELTLYRVIQELINNTIKHANASSIDIVVRQAKDHMLIEYSDNGENSLDIATTKSEGYGLRNIENRLLVIQASAQWIPKKQGMAIRILIPLTNKES